MDINGGESISKVAAKETMLDMNHNHRLELVA